MSHGLGSVPEGGQAPHGQTLGRQTTYDTAAPGGAAILAAPAPPGGHGQLLGSQPQRGVRFGEGPSSLLSQTALKKNKEELFGKFPLFKNCEI